MCMWIICLERNVHNVADPKVWGGNNTLKSMPSRHTVSSKEPLLPKNGSISFDSQSGRTRGSALCSIEQSTRYMKGSTWRWWLCGRSKDVVYDMDHVIFKTCICGGYKIEHTSLLQVCVPGAQHNLPLLPFYYILARFCQVAVQQTAKKWAFMVWIQHRHILLIKDLISVRSIETRYFSIKPSFYNITLTTWSRTIDESISV